MRNKFDHACGWFRKGESDLATVRGILAANGPYDTSCFHAQQAIEKYLKGVFVSAYRSQSNDHVRPKGHL
jgi:HEPN domain-containing protein